MRLVWVLLVIFKYVEGGDEKWELQLDNGTILRGDGPIPPAEWLQLGGSGEKPEKGQVAKSLPPVKSKSRSQKQKKTCRIVRNDFKNLSKCTKCQDKICRITFGENCQQKTMQDCVEQESTKTNRKCFTVDDLKCKLKETLEFEEIWVTRQEQKCIMEDDRICDTVHELEQKTNTVYKCVPLKKWKCNEEVKTLKEKTCHYTSKVNCGKNGKGGIVPNGEGNQGELLNRNGDLDIGNQTVFLDIAGRGGDKHVPKPTCQEGKSAKCNETPRTVTTKKCEQMIKKECRTLQQEYPSKIQKTHCRNVQKKVCQLKEVRVPMKIKKYSYKKECKNVPTKICGDETQKQLTKKCQPTKVNHCDFKAKPKQCKTTARNHCCEYVEKIPKKECKKEWD